MINVFSRDAMINRIITQGVSSDEYYISILPTGGPNSMPIFDNNSPNVITLVFDDVVNDCIKTQHPHNTNLRYARAMTVHQADELCKFIKQIPSGSIINIHCVWGEKRSLAVAAAINNSYEQGNKLVYKLVKERLHT